MPRTVKVKTTESGRKVKIKSVNEIPEVFAIEMSSGETGHTGKKILNLTVEKIVAGDDNSYDSGRADEIRKSYDGAFVHSFPTTSTSELEQSKPKKRKISPILYLPQEQIEHGDMDDKDDKDEGCSRGIELGEIPDSDSLSDDVEKGMFGPNISNLVVRNLHKSVDNELLFQFFAPFGEIISYKVATANNGGSLGFGYVRFRRVEEMNAAIQFANGLMWFGRNLIVEKFLSKRERSRRSYKDLKDQQLMSGRADEIRKSYDGALVHSFPTTSTSELEQSKPKKRKISPILYLPQEQIEHGDMDDKDDKDEGCSRGIELGEIPDSDSPSDDVEKGMFGPNASNLVVRNLHKSVDNELLFQFFAPFGEIISHKVATANNGGSLGFGYVRFRRVEEMNAAIQFANGLMWFGRNLIVEKFLSKRERSRRSYKDLKAQQLMRTSTSRPELTITHQLKTTVGTDVEEIFACSKNVASFINRKYSDQYTRVRFLPCSDGMKLVGGKECVKEVMDLLLSKTIECRDIEFVLPDLSKYFKNSEFRAFIESLENRFNCFVDIPTDCKALLPVLIEVVQIVPHSHVTIKPDEEVTSSFPTCAALHGSSTTENNENIQKTTMDEMKQNTQSMSIDLKKQNTHSASAESADQNMRFVSADLTAQNTQIMSANLTDQNMQIVSADLTGQNMQIVSANPVNQNVQFLSTDSINQSTHIASAGSTDQNTQSSSINNVSDQNMRFAFCNSSNAKTQSVSSTNERDQKLHNPSSVPTPTNTESGLTNSTVQPLNTNPKARDILKCEDLRQCKQLGDSDRTGSNASTLKNVVSSGNDQRLSDDDMDCSRALEEGKLCDISGADYREPPKRDEDGIPLAIISFKSPDELVQELSSELDRLKRCQASSVTLESFDTRRNNLSVRAVADSLSKVLSRFQDKHLDVLDPTSRSDIEFIRILIRKPELVPIFEKFAVPAQDSCRRLGKNPDKGIITVVSSNPTSMEKVTQEIQKHKKQQFCKSVCVDEYLCEFEENETREIGAIASSKSVCCCFQKKKSLLLYGLKLKVNRVAAKIKKINDSFKLAKIISETCCWMWESNPDHFVPLPIRVASKLEYDGSSTSSKSFKVLVYGEKVEMNTSEMTYKMANKSGRIKREDARRLTEQSGPSKLQRPSKFSSFVVEKPNIKSSKLKYIKSLLCGDFKDRAEMKLNQLFDRNKLKVRCAVFDSNVKLVADSTGTFSRCCLLLEEEIHFARERVAPCDLGSEKNQALIRSKLLPLNMEWLGFNCENDKVEVASFCKDDIIKALDVIKASIENCLTTKLFPCGEDIASYVIKVFLKTWRSFGKTGDGLLSFDKTDDGLEIKGSKVTVEKAMLALGRMNVSSVAVEVAAPPHTLFADELQKVCHQVETKCLCSISTSKVDDKVDDNDDKEINFTPGDSPLKFEVCQGDIVEEKTDSIVSGVGNGFDLNWGKVSPSILAKAGGNIADDCRNNPLVSTPYVRVTSAGNLPCKYIFHLVTPSSCDDLTKRMKIVLDEAEKLGVQSISFPTLGAGGIGLEACSVAEAMKDAFFEFLVGRQNPETHIKLIRVVVFEPIIVDTFKLIINTLNEIKSNRTIGTKNEKWLVKITSSNLHLTEAKQEFSCCYDKIIKNTKEEDERILDLEEHDVMELDDYARSHQVFCQLVFSGCPSISISGMERDVDLMLDQVQMILDEATEAAVIAKSGMWMWKTHEEEEFAPLPLRISRQMISQHKKSKQKPAEVRVCGEQISIDFSTLTFTFRDSAKSGKICLKEVEEKAEKLPREWDSMNNQSVKKCPLPSFSKEYLQVKQEFDKSNPRYSSIVSIKRVQNPALYRHYRIEKDNVERHIKGSNLVQRNLFHGTSSEDSEKICQFGFNRSFAGKNATAYGRGTYFACESSYSVDYANSDINGHKHMFLAHVLTGDYCQGSQSFVSAPPQGDGSLYHSVVNSIHSPTMFVVFTDASAYPAYLITFY